jgi:hypothetical protein
MAHNESIIQWMLAVIIGFSALLVFRAVFGKKDADAGYSSAGGDVQDLLKKVLDQTSILEKAMMSAPAPVVMPVSAESASAPAATAAAVSASASVDPLEIAKLKKLIEERDEELNRLKNDPNAAKLRDQIAKVQELQNRLKEYEILEDDIADLSLYKEENARLKSELQKLVGGDAAAAATPVPEAASTVAAAPPGDALVDQFAQVVDQTKGLETAPNAEGAAHLPQTGDPMADFAQTVQMEKEGATAPAAPAPTEAAVPLSVVPPVEASSSPTPAAEAATAGEPSQANDLFAEFSNGNLDTDKVMEELVSIEKLPATDGKEALEGALDADKVVAEAAGFSKN